MTQPDIFERLVKLASAPNGGASGGVVLACDMIHQESLYQLQYNLTMLLFDVARGIGPDALEDLCATFPYVFEKKFTPKGGV